MARSSAACRTPYTKAETRASLVLEVAKFGGDVSGMVPPKVAKRLKERFAEQSAGGDT